MSQTLDRSAAITSSTQNTTYKEDEISPVKSDDTKAQGVPKQAKPKESQDTESEVQEVSQPHFDESRGSSPDSTANTSSQSQPTIGKRIDLAGGIHNVHADTPESDDDDLKDGEDKIGSQNDQENLDNKSVADSIDEKEVFRKIDILVAPSQQSLGENNDDGDDEEKREESFVFNDLNDVKNGEDEDEDLSRQNYGKNKSIRARVKEWKSRRVEYAEDMPRTYEVFQQACYYLGAFYCTHVWSTSNRVVQAISGGGTVFPLLACHSFFDPFQGFLNYLVYQRPRLIQLKKKHPELGWWRILMKSLRFSFMDGGKSLATRS